MPPYYAIDTKRALMLAAPVLAKRDLSVNHTQGVTLGVMAAYVVVIALLWNLPYLRWSLWPFKVRSLPINNYFSIHSKTKRSNNRKQKRC